MGTAYDRMPNMVLCKRFLRMGLTGDPRLSTELARMPEPACVERTVGTSDTISLFRSRLC